METPIERAKIYREMRENGKTKNQVIELAKEIEYKNENSIINLSYLSPNGAILQAVEQLDASDKQNKLTIEKIADYIGEARKNYSVLNNVHEKEMFSFLIDENQSKRIKTKTDFLQKINAIVTAFDFEASQTLNLKRFKYKSEGESIYDSEFNELQNKIKELLDKKLSFTERITNPKSLDYINPKAKDYTIVMEQVTIQTQKINNEIKNYQSKLIDLQRNKSNYINAGSNQIGLFGTEKKSIQVSKPISTNPKVQKIGASSNVKSSYFNVAGEVGKFLQGVERKPVHSVVITLDGQQGAGKTTTLYKFMEAFAVTGNKCLFISGEEHPDSDLAKGKVKDYLTETAKKNIDTIGEIETADELYKLINPYDIIFVDSWQKLQRMVGNIRLDEDLRKKFDGKVFVIIFQQTTTGRTKGGAEVVFDGDIITKMVKGSRFTDNYAYFDKNRYTKVHIETLRYNIASGKLYNPEQPATETQPVASTKLSFSVN